MRAGILGMVLVSLIAASAAAQQPMSAQQTMKPSAPTKMTSERDQKKMKECETLAAKQNVPMDRRSKFVMECMTYEAIPY